MLICVQRIFAPLRTDENILLNGMNGYFEIRLSAIVAVLLFSLEVVHFGLQGFQVDFSSRPEDREALVQTFQGLRGVDGTGGVDPPSDGGTVECKRKHAIDDDHDRPHRELHELGDAQVHVALQPIRLL